MSAPALIPIMLWVMNGVSSAYKVAEREGLSDEDLQHGSNQLEVATHHGPNMQVAWFVRLRTGAKVLNLSSNRLQIDSEAHVRAMVLNCLASYLQWCEHDRDRAVWAASSRRGLKHIRRPKIPQYGDGAWQKYRESVDSIWCTMAASTE